MTLWLAGATAGFAEYPERPIRLLLPFPAGGAVDIVARTMTAKMSDDLGKPFIIENKSGAGGIIATDAVAKSPPDGYTLLLTTPNHTINAALQAVAALRHREGPGPGLGDRRGAGGAGEQSRRAVCDTSPSSSPTPRPIPASSNYASAGIGTLPHVTMELLLRRIGVEVAHIPYRGAAPAMTDLLAGVVQLKLDTYTTANPQVQAGKLRMLGIASAHRSQLMPEVPTIAEMGLPGYEGILWNAIMAPAGTPQAIIDRLAAASAKAARAPDIVERLQRDGVDPVGGTPAELAALIAREMPQWRELAKAANIKLQ